MIVSDENETILEPTEFLRLLLRQLEVGKEGLSGRERQILGLGIEDTSTEVDDQGNLLQPPLQLNDGEVFNDIVARAEATTQQALRQPSRFSRLRDQEASLTENDLEGLFR